MSQHVHQEANELHRQAARLQTLLRQLDEQGSLVVDFTAIWHVLLEINLKLRAILEGHERQLQGATAVTAGQAIRGIPAESQASRIHARLADAIGNLEARAAHVDERLVQHANGIDSLREQVKGLQRREVEQVDARAEIGLQIKETNALFQSQVDQLTQRHDDLVAEIRRRFDELHRDVNALCSFRDKVLQETRR